MSCFFHYQHRTAVYINKCLNELNICTPKRKSMFQVGSGWQICLLGFVKFVVAGLQEFLVLFAHHNMYFNMRLAGLIDFLELGSGIFERWTSLCTPCFSSAGAWSLAIKVLGFGAPSLGLYRSWKVPGEARFQRKVPWKVLVIGYRNRFFSKRFQQKVSTKGFNKFVECSSKGAGKRIPVQSQGFQ